MNKTFIACALTALLGVGLPLGGCTTEAANSSPTPAAEMTTVTLILPAMT